MIVINIGGGPGSGKTTLAYYLTYRLKQAGLRTEFVGEAAREEHIYDSTPGIVPPPLLDNQILLAGQQYERLKRLERHKFQVAVNDSPMLQGLLYCTNISHKLVLEPLLYLLDREFRNLNIFACRKPGTYDPESRVQKTEKDAIAFDERVGRLTTWHYMHYWGKEERLANNIIDQVEEAVFDSTHET